MTKTPYQTQKEEWEEMAKNFYPYFCEYLRSKATPIDGIEVYAPTDYEEFAQCVKSLPARYDRQGVRKTVLVPVEILSRDAKKAAEEAIAATEQTRKATAEANTARDNANRAASQADLARENLEEIKAQTLAARNAANDAANSANLAASEARATNEEMQSAESLREQAFRNALSKFDSSLTELEGFTELAREAWNRFVAEYEEKQLEISVAEKQRKANETARQQAEEKREEALNTALENLDNKIKVPDEDFVDSLMAEWDKEFELTDRKEV